VQRALRLLSGTTRGKIVRKSVTQGGQIMSRHLKGISPTETGLMRKAIGHKIVVYRLSSIGVAIIGPRRGFKRDVKVSMGTGRKKRTSMELRDPVKYFHLVAGGRKEVRPVSAKVMASALHIWGTRAKAVAGKDLLNKTWMATKTQVQQRVVAVTQEELRKVGRR